MDKINLPFVLPKPQQKLTNASPELYRHLNPLGTFIGESQIAAHLYGEKPSKSFKVSPTLYHWFDEFVSMSIEDEPPMPIPAPSISINSEELNESIRDLPRKLFHTAITQLVAAYEGFIEDIANDIYRYNPHLLAIDERQLTSEEIIQLGNFVMKFTAEGGRRT